MTGFDKAKFWDGLDRLHNENVALRDATQALARRAERRRDRLDQVKIIIENSMQSHEQRMQQIEASHQEFRKDLEVFKQRQEAELEQLRELRQIAQAHEKRLGDIQ